MDRTATNQIPTAEFDQLAAELSEARKRLHAAFHTEPPGEILKGAHLTLYLAEAENVIGIVRRMREVKEPPLPKAAQYWSSPQFARVAQARRAVHEI